MAEVTRGMDGRDVSRLDELLHPSPDTKPCILDKARQAGRQAQKQRTKKKLKDVNRLIIEDCQKLVRTHTAPSKTITG